VKSVKVIVTGKVQGVYYRASTQAQAKALGLVGWVRNESDGSVCYMAQGEESAIDALIEWSKLGPEMAKVSQVSVPPGQELDMETFDILY